MVGRQVGHYRFVEQLGAGGMGEIFKAHDSRLQRFVAIKVLSAEKAGNADMRRRFLQEAQAASALNHPNIITIYDILSEGDTDFMVLEFVPGMSLAEVLDCGALPAAQVIAFGMQVAEALGAAHAAGIVHRDLKPGNVMVTEGGRIKVLDFGLAKLTFGGPVGLSGPDAPTTVMGPMTVEGSVIGTINYMSPEQAEGKRVDGRSDIFSFGLLLYEMITGRRGFERDSALSTLTSILRDEVRPIPEFVSNAPPMLEHLINRCLRKRPEDRWQTIQEVHGHLAAMKAELSPVILAGAQPAVTAQAAARLNPPPPPPAKTADPPKKSSGGVLIAAAVVVVLLVIAVGGAGAWWYLQKRNAQPEGEPVTAVEPLPAPPAEPATVTPADTPLPPPPPVTLSPAQSEPAPAVAKTKGKSGPKSVAEPPPAEPVPAPALPPAAEPSPRPAPAVAMRTVTLPDAMPMNITLNHDIQADSPAGTPLHFTVAQDFRVGDTVAVAKGATVVGEIVDPGRRRLIGGAKMTFRLSQTVGVDGKKVNVRATPGRQNTRPVETPVKPKGKDLIASTGAAYIAYIDGQQTLSVRE